MTAAPTRQCLGLLLSVAMISACSAPPVPIRPTMTARPPVDLTKKIKGKLARM